jgi:UDP:flavonoid glycosyltransferase YjiC (YdhE family)
LAETGSSPVRVLLAASGGAGHFGPLTAIIDALARRGAEQLIVVPPALAAFAEATGHRYRLCAEPPAAEREAIWARVPRSDRHQAAILVNRHIFGRLNTAAMLPAVESACREWRPDLVLHEVAEYSSVIAAARNGIRHAQIAIGLAEVENGSLALAAPELETYATGTVDTIRASPYLTRLPASVDPSPYPDTRRFHEVAADTRRPWQLPDWWEGSDAPLVYVSFGTVVGDLPIGPVAYRAAVEAVTQLPVRVLLSLGHTRDASELGPLPGNVHVESWVPQADVLRHAVALVCHGGAGTTFGGLALGVPLVVVPIMADQPANARLVSTAGAGLVVEPVDGSVDAAALRDAIAAVLADASYRRAAVRIGTEMEAMPTVDEALGSLLADGRAIGDSG